MVGKRLVKQRSKISVAGEEYDSVVNDLVQKCEFAKKIGDKKIKKAVLNIIKNWKEFFQVEKKEIKKIKKDEQKESVLKFIDKQIKFFDSLAKKVRK